MIKSSTGKLVAPLIYPSENSSLVRTSSRYTWSVIFSSWSARMLVMLVSVYDILSVLLIMDSTKAMFEDKIIEEPLKYYIEYRDRLEKDGLNASFPEFKPTVDYLVSEINSDYFKPIIEAHPDLDLEVKEVKTLLAHVNLDFVFDDEENYPYPRPFPGPFPYRPTIDAIESALRLLDKLNRFEPGNRAVPLYHFDRYAYHRHSLVTDPNIIVFPTIKNLTFFDLIRVRSVPIGFVGVVSRTIRVDRHYQSPLDFWYHDLNHVRRMYGYINLRQKQLEIKTKQEQIDYYRKMDNFILEKIVPNILKLPKGSPRDEIALRRMVRMIFFEILHESALTAEPDVIIEDLLRPSGPQPFEHMMTKVEKHDKDSIEKLRTPTGNIKSGISQIKDTNETVFVRYFFDRAIALLGNVYNKLNFGFYDDPESPSEFVVPLGYRKVDHIVMAAKKIFEILGVRDIPSDDVLLSLASTKEGSEEKFVYKGISMDDGEIFQYATEPISSGEVIKQVKALGKKVYTIFGFSKLGYQNWPEVAKQIESELSKQNPNDTLICIGATEDGIGKAYEIAKKGGFETIGIVSTNALSYSGKFSDFVDRIYIVNDTLWGGYVPGTNKLAETTTAFLGTANEIHAFGGGKNTAVTLSIAKQTGVPAYYTPAEMNHMKALQEAKEKDLEEPKDFWGAAKEMESRQ